jgi:hypothetical protein
MKALNVLSAISLLAIGSSSAFADVTLHVTAGTFYRSAVTNAIVHLLSQGGGTVKVAYVGTTLAGSSQAVFQGSVPASSSAALAALGTITVEASYAGSITSIASLANQSASSSKLTYPTAAALGSVTATASAQTPFASNFGLLPGALASGSGITLNGSNSEVSSPDVAIEDVFQSSSPFSSANGFTALTDQLVGVAPYTWVKNAALTSDPDYVSGGYGRLKNLTSLQAKAIFTEGLVTGSDLTDNSGDQFTVSLAGRDYDAGTRFDTIAEAESSPFTPITQFGVINSSPAAGGPNATIVNGHNVQVQSALSATLPASGGYSSGGSLAVALETPGTDTASDFGGYLVSYLGAADADTALNVAGGPTGYVAPSLLTYDGVVLNKANVLNGTYSFWTYVHFLTIPANIVGNKQTFITALFNQIYNTDTQVSGYRIGDLATGVSRQTEGGVISLP